MATHLDWTRASIGDPAPCVLCHRPALCRSPDKGVPCHKTCAEAWIDARQREAEQAAETGAELFDLDDQADADEL